MEAETMTVSHRADDVALRIIELACRAPSVHNTQPWIWRVDGQGVELWADRTRQLLVADPEGRNLLISCGAALQHVQVAAAAIGWIATVNRMPDAQEPDFLARIELMPSGLPVTADGAAQLRAIEERCTDRRRFTSWPIPDERLHHLVGAARHWGAQIVPLTDITARFRVELLVSRATHLQDSDERFADEERLWIDHSGQDGIPARAIPRFESLRGERRSRFGHSLYPDAPEKDVESSDGLMVIGTAYDGPLSWLQAGGALGALWLQATRDGLSVVPLSQVVEIEETRLALQREVFSDLAEPQILVRIGWQEIGRSTLPRTPRRTLDDVVRQ